MLLPDHLLLPAFSLVLGALVAVLAHRWMMPRLVKQQPQLCSFADAPWFMKGNPHITHGYRSGFTWRETLQSIAWGHNETANIWSHFLGSWIFAAVRYSNRTHTVTHIH